MDLIIEQTLLNDQRPGFATQTSLPLETEPKYIRIHNSHVQIATLQTQLIVKLYSVSSILSTKLAKQKRNPNNCV